MIKRKHDIWKCMDSMSTKDRTECSHTICSFNDSVGHVQSIPVILGYRSTNQDIIGSNDVESKHMGERNNVKWRRSCGNEYGTKKESGKAALHNLVEEYAFD